MTKNTFLYPYARYRGEFTPAAFLFNANLQEFAQRISIICSLHTNGKLSSTETFEQIKSLWHQLQIAREQLEMGNPENDQ